MSKNIMKKSPIRELMPFRVPLRTAFSYSSEKAGYAEVDIYWIIREPTTGELLAVTSYIYGHYYKYVISTWGGVGLCLGSNAKDTARAALAKIARGISSGKDFLTALSSRSRCDNPLPSIQLRPEWFVLPEQRAVLQRRSGMKPLTPMQRDLLLSMSGDFVSRHHGGWMRYSDKRRIGHGTADGLVERGLASIWPLGFDADELQLTCAGRALAEKLASEQNKRSI